MPELTHLTAWLEHWAHTQGPIAEAAIRLIWAALLGGLIGLERENRGHDAGFRTCMLVSLGSALAMVVSISFTDTHWAGQPAGEAIHIDPARIAYGVMGGVGFLGAGSILKQGLRVRGLTTAATVWCVAAMGLGAGAGLLTITFIAGVLVLTTLLILEQLKRMVPDNQTVLVHVRTDWSDQVLSVADRWFKDAPIKVVGAGLSREDTPQDRVDLQLELRGPRLTAQAVIDLLNDQPGTPDIRRIEPGKHGERPAG